MRNLLTFLFFGVFIVSIAVFSYYLVYQYGGLKHYLSAVNAINSLSEVERAPAREQFSGSGEENLYGGTLMSVNTKGYGGVWVWGNKGPKYFKADEYSSFSYYAVCGPDDSTDFGETLEIPRSVDINIRDWEAKVQKGDWTTIVVAEEGHGGNIGNLREAISFNRWLFIPGTITNPC